MRRRRFKGEWLQRSSPLHAGQIPMVTLLQLLTVAEHLNFRHAANELGVAQSSVSARIKALEFVLNIVIFERRHRGVRLTEAGRYFVDEVSASIERIDHAVRTAGATSNGKIGHLTIGLQGSIATGFFADLRRRYQVTQPTVEQNIVEGASSSLLALIREGKLDVAFIFNVSHVFDCHSRHFWSEKLVIALPAGHFLASSESVTWSDLASECFLVRQGGAGAQIFDHIIRRVGECGQAPRLYRRDVGRDTLMLMVAAGEGVTLTHEAGGHIPFPGVVFRPIDDEGEYARFSAVWSPQNRSPMLRNLLDLAKHMSRSIGSLP